MTEDPRILSCMIRDRHRIAGLAREIDRAKSSGANIDGQISKLESLIARSTERFNFRRQQLPRPTYPADLPISAKRDEIAALIRDNQVVILCGETGSGKTTQLPKICLELGRGVAGMIGHTQPRRIAARSIAARLSQELGVLVGNQVGYKIRFTDKVSDNTFVKLMTDGILLAETQGDRYLEAYDTIIVDEAHERSLNIDFLLGYLQRLLPQRRDLKLIITSATIDPQRFSQHFEGAPIIEVSGRTYPVETRYRPLITEDPDAEDLTQIQGILASVDELCASGFGDVLVFLAGEREIRETAEALRKHHPADTEILPLYSRLSADEQNKVFNPHGRRRIILSTNVAETSLTVPGIRYVVDPGIARVSRYSSRSRVQRLPIERISQASADQRKGRCGRVSDGICIRLYSEQDYQERARFTEPEILRTNLASVILQMKSLKLGQIEAFPFLEPPDGRFIRDGYLTLHEIGAVDDQNELTLLGWSLAKLPVDPRIGRMVMAAVEEDCLDEVLIIASALSVQDPRERPMDQAQAADTAHAAFRDESSDFVSFLNLWKSFHHQMKHLSHSKLRKWCREHFISYLRMREWHDVHTQLHALVTEMAIRPHRKQQQPQRPSITRRKL